jgi:lipoate-protein ligase A
MTLEILPTRVGGAAENMAVDFLMLQRYPRETVSRFRHYSWRSPAFTFGYSQKIALVRAALPSDESFDLCRRPTGGGIVDHRDDWTFSLVIPRGHRLEEMRAMQSYLEVHQCLSESLRRQDVAAVTKPAEVGEADINGKTAAGLCFDRAEAYDVINRSTGQKIAGAAQKRNKRGLLFQGSLWRPALGKVINEDQLRDDFVDQLAKALGATADEVPWPDFDEDEVSALTDTYASTEWMETR